VVGFYDVLGYEAVNLENISRSRTPTLTMEKELSPSDFNTIKSKVK
jgi:hypothetical protein